MSIAKKKLATKVLLSKKANANLITIHTIRMRSNSPEIKAPNIERTSQEEVVTVVKS